MSFNTKYSFFLICLFDFEYDMVKFNFFVFDVLRRLCA